MTCKLNGLFSIGEDFDDEDLPGTDRSVRSASGASDVAAVVSSCSLRAPTAAHTEPERKHLQRSAQRSTAASSSSNSSTHTDAAAAAGQTVVVGLRQLSTSSSSSSSSSSQPHSLRPPTQNNTLLAQQPKPCAAQDDFDDWDVDLADLDECDGQMGQPPQPPAPSPSAPTAEPASSAKTLRAPTCGGLQTLPDRTLREVNAARQPCSSSNHNLPSQILSSIRVRSPLPRPAFLPPHSPGFFSGLTSTSPAPSPISRSLIRPQPPQRLWSTPGPSPQARGFFETVSPAPSSSTNSTMLSPHPLRTPLLTNRLVQLVSASNRLPSKRPHSEPHRTRTRRFPGPAGFLPEQTQGQSLDDVVVSVPHTPAHGAVARSPNQVSSSQTEEDEFSGGAWAAMKAEMGLDERNPSCFLQTYSVVMVLRKAALKQLAKNKVPNMAVLLKSIVHTNTDAKAVFKDPTGEIQGTVHRRLLEERAEELKVGAVLLLKQVGVFSPSHRNHYLNVTQNNLLRIYTSDGVGLSSTQLSPLFLEPMLQSTAQPPTIRREPVSQMHLVFDEEEDERQEGGRCTEGGKDPQAPTDGRLRSSGGPQQPAGNPAPQNPDWDEDDDLDELLGELPDDSYSL
ncbi:unnamed protein product [Pleuronectes platessa]|uniref:Homologous recombination OB-fold protein OB-fold domain-containing protein n=1 Tax=Pleuronectes platessa TaxID=8262 RepID=A0A9N7V0E1_PLEPL|nr:unnamed protein product [Pleuronectes platessa]